MQVSFHLYAGLFLFVCRSLFTCIQISFHLYTGLFSFVYRSLFVCIQVSFHLYAGFFSFVCRSLFICIQVSFYLYTYLFSFVYRFLFMCIQVSFNWFPCSSLMHVHRRPVYKWKETCIQMKRDLHWANGGFWPDKFLAKIHRKKNSPSISLWNNVAWWRRSAAPERSMTDLA